jgi:amidase
MRSADSRAFARRRRRAAANGETNGMGGFADFARFDGLGLAELVRRREVAPIELVEEAIARIEARNPTLNAVVCKLYDSARATARGPLSGPLAGVPFLLKDLGATLAGTPTSEGNRRLAKIPRDADSELVVRYRKAGLVFVAKTNAPEFGLAPVTEPEAFGPCRNPWDVSRTPGGSSGGSGAAVAARMTPFAHASDGGGSIRIPASCCGLVGLKPTRGRTPTGPVEGEAWRGFTIGNALTRSVRDCAALLDAVQGADVGAPYEIKPPARPYRDEVGAPPGRLRIAFTVAPLLTDEVHPDCVAGVQATAALLADLGHEVVEATPPLDREPWLDAFVKIVAAETCADIQRAERLVGRKFGIGDLEIATCVVGSLGRSFSAADYAAAARFAQRWSRQAGAFFSGYDVLLTPTLAQPPLLHGALKPTPLEAAALQAVGRLHAGWFMRVTGLARELLKKPLSFIPYTPLFNVTGQPAMSLPLHWNAAGLPIGMQFVARLGDETTLFRLASQLEQARPWFDRAPPGY